ncbi:MAG: transglycosylase-like protein [Patescibacteria group bacterium]|nr:transglycosylase-like protein [Patescibacteria group bacterium]
MRNANDSLTAALDLLKRLKTQPRNLVAIGILITIVSFGFSSGRLPVSPAANADSQRMVSLYVDGQKRLFATDGTSVGDILSRAGVKLTATDLVEPGLKTAVPKGQFNINVYRARPVLVGDGARTYHLSSAYQSPRLLAKAAGITVYPEDTYRTEVITNVVENGAIGEKINITRAKPFVVTVDGHTRTLRTQAKTIGDALKSANIALGLKDTVSQPLAAPVLPGASLSITRVTEALATLTETIPRPVKVIQDPAMLKGQTNVKTEGADGQKTITYRIHYQNGIETGREQIQLVSQSAPAARVVTEGTKVLFSGSVEYWRPQVEAAAAAWNFDPNTMLRIMACESRGNALSISHFVINGEHPTGLFQYLPSTWRSSGGTDDNILDGAMQIQLTAKKMATQGTKAWQCK